MRSENYDNLFKYNYSQFYMGKSIDQEAGKMTTGKYWIPIAGPVLIAIDKMIGRKMIPSKEQFKSKFMQNALPITYLSYQGLSLLAATGGALYGLSKLA